MLVIDIAAKRTLFEQRGDILERPTHPGSIAKVFALVAAVDSGEVDTNTRIACREREVVGGRTLECAHPKFGRPLSAVEALAHSCNSFFAAIAKRTTWPRIAAEWHAAGLPASPPPKADVLGAVGLEGPQASPRALLSAFARVVDNARRRNGPGDRLLLDGLLLAGKEGTARAFDDWGVEVLAKTGSGRIYGGAPGGLVVALHPAQEPRFGVVVIGAGIAGRDAAEIGAVALRRYVPALRDADKDAGANATGNSAVEDRIRVGLTEGERVRVADLSFEDYVAGVVSAEASPTAPAVVREALAVAARSYATTHRSRHQPEGFDVCDLTHCQAYRVPDPTSVAAARSTAGLVLTHHGLVVPAFHSASCGGQLEAPNVTWPGGDAWLDMAMPARPDPVAHDSDSWQTEVVAPDLVRALSATGWHGNDLVDLSVLEHSRSGRVLRLRLAGLTPPSVSGEAFRLAVGRTLGWNVLKSTLFTITRTSRGYRFDGRGRGHGVGLCVAGASQLALQGRSRTDILATYFPGAAIVAGTTRERSSGCRVTLPSLDESDREVIEGLVTRALADLEKRTGTPVPADLEMRFHPTVQSYVRAGGRGWWTGGVTRGHRIEMAPIENLRQRGVLERTVRHELAHALTWNAVAGRPLWVGEGLADYFAEPARSTNRAPESCPGDEAFTTTRSPGALATLYEQARACIARALEQSGGDWRKAVSAAR